MLLLCHQMHQEIQWLFGSTRAENNVLYYVGISRNKFYVYVRSTKKPEMNSTVLKCLYSVEETEEYENNKVYRFQIACNPTKQRCGKRTGLTNREDVLAWLARKGEMNGFEVLDTYACGISKEYVAKEENSFTFVKAEITGSLVVTDKEKFAECVERGIGRELAYGCGMLLLAA